MIGTVLTHAYVAIKYDIRYIDSIIEHTSAGFIFNLLRPSDAYMRR